MIYLTGNLILAYNVLFILGFTLCAFGNFLFVQYLTGSRLAGILGGIELAYSTYMLSNYAQLPYITAQWIPFTFLYLLKFFKDRTYKHGLFFTLFYLLQALSSAYYGLFLTLFVAIFMLALGIQQKLFWIPRFWKQLVLFLIIILPTLSLFLYPYLVVKDLMGFQRGLEEIHIFSANIRDYARVMPNNYLYGEALYPPGIGTTSPFWLFPGVTALFLSFLGLSNLRQEGSLPPWKKLFFQSFWILLLIWFFLLFALGYESMIIPLLLLSAGWLIYVLYKNRKQRTYLYIFLVCLILAFLFSFGPIMSFHEKELPYGPYLLLYHWVPGFKGIRVVSRFNIMVTFFLGVLAGFGLVKLLSFISSKYIQGTLGILLAAILFLEHYTGPMWVVQVNPNNQIPEVYIWLRNQPGDFVILELPWKLVDTTTAYHAMTTHGKKTVGGYSSFFPPFNLWFFQQMENFPSERSIEMIRAMGVRYLILHNRRFIQEKKISNLFHRLMEFSESLRLVKHFPSSDTYVFEVVGAEEKLFNLETTRDPVRLIFPDQVPHQREVVALLDISLSPGDLRLSPYPEFNSRVIVKWIENTGLSVEYSQDVHLPGKFLLSEVDHQLAFIVKTPPVQGTFLLEIYDRRGRRLLDKKQVTVN